MAMLIWAKENMLGKTDASYLKGRRSLIFFYSPNEQISTGFDFFLFFLVHIHVQSFIQREKYPRKRGKARA